MYLWSGVEIFGRTELLRAFGLEDVFDASADAGLRINNNNSSSNNNNNAE